MHDDPNDQSLSELLQRLSNQTSSLVRQEIRLAQVELQEKGRHAGLGIGMFGASGLLVMFAIGALVTAAILALATAVDAWLAALIVAVVLLAAAGVIALTGKRQVEQATPPVPEAATESVQTDLETLKERTRHA